MFAFIFILISLSKLAISYEIQHKSALNNILVSESLLSSDESNSSFAKISPDNTTVKSFIEMPIGNDIEIHHLFNVKGNVNIIKSAAMLDKETVYKNYSALSNFIGEIDENFLKRINPHWLKFPAQSQKSHYLLAVIYCIMVAFGLTGNGLVIYIYIRYRSVRSPANNFIFNLAVSDFIIMLEAPIFIYNSLHFGPASGDFMCRVYALLGGLGGTMAIMTLAVISIDRYNVLVFPLNPSRATTNLRSKLMIVFIWIYSSIFAIIPLIEVGSIRYGPEGFLTCCSFDYINKEKDNQIFIFVYFIFAFVLPLSAIVYCYIYILHVVLSAKKIQSSKEKNKTEIKLAGIVMGVIGIWILAWTPYAIISLLGIFGHEEYITPLSSMFPSIFAKTAACVDPYLYAVTHPRFKTIVEKMFCSKRAANDNQNQTSRYSRGASVQEASECETVYLEDNVGNRRKKLERAESSVCEETSMSAASVDGGPESNAGKY